MKNIKVTEIILTPANEKEKLFPRKDFRIEFEPENELEMLYPEAFKSELRNELVKLYERKRQRESDSFIKNILKAIAE